MSCSKTCQCEQATKKGSHADPKTLPYPENLQKLIEGLHKFYEYDKIVVKDVKAYMELYKSNPKEWEKYAKWDVHRYTRNLVDAGNGKFNLLALCWNKGQGSSIHSHANAHCFMKILDGKVQEEQFEWPSETEGEQHMKKREVVYTHEKDKCAYICDEIGLHRVSNPSNVYGAVTLHLYSPPFDLCDTFDEWTGHKGQGQMILWSEYGQLTKYGQTGGETCN